MVEITKESLSFEKTLPLVETSSCPNKSHSQNRPLGTLSWLFASWPWDPRGGLYPPGGPSSSPNFGSAASSVVATAVV